MAKWHGLKICYLFESWLTLPEFHISMTWWCGGDDGQAQCHILFNAPVTQLWNLSIRMGTEFLCKNAKERNWQQQRDIKDNNVWYTTHISMVNIFNYELKQQNIHVSLFNYWLNGTHI